METINLFVRKLISDNVEDLDSRNFLFLVILLFIIRRNFFLVATIFLGDNQFMYNLFVRNVENLDSRNFLFRFIIY